MQVGHNGGKKNVYLWNGGGKEKRDIWEKPILYTKFFCKHKAA